MKIFYLGPKNSYSYHAAHTYVKKHLGEHEKHQYIPCETFANVFDEVGADDTSYGIVALTNTLAGDIEENILRLEKMKNTIVSIDTITLKIELNLIGLENSSLNKIKTVYSHPKALAESSVFLNKHSIKGIEVNSTSRGFDKITTENNPSYAAIGHKSLANNLGVKILAQNIDNNPENYTTFAIIQRRNTQR